jgi:hypothetical protein
MKGTERGALVAACGIVVLLIAAVPEVSGDEPAASTIVAPAETDAGAEVTVERAVWVRQVGAGVPIVVDNPFGDVHLRSSGPGGVLDVSAVMQQLAVDGVRLDLDVDPTSEAVAVRIVRTVKPGVVAPADDRSRADLAVLAPDGATVTVTTDAGAVESKGVQGGLTISTRSGPITVRQKLGMLSLRSDNGDITAFLEPGATAAPESFESVTGGITLWLRDAADANVDLATSGTITTDFSITVEHHDHAEPDKNAHTTIGAAGRSVTMTSRRGDLALRRLLPQPLG